MAIKKTGSKTAAYNLYSVNGQAMDLMTIWLTVLPVLPEAAS